MKQRLTLEKIAADIGISVATVSFLMSGKRHPSWVLAKRLSERFGNHPAWWMEATGEMIEDAIRGNEDRNGKKRRAA